MGDLLLKFKSKDSPYGVTRNTLKSVANELDLSETAVVHLALSRFAQETLPAYDPDDDPITKADLNRLRKAVKAKWPKGKLLSSRSLF